MAPCCSRAQTSFCERASHGSLSCGACASSSAIAHAGRLIHCRREHRPTSVAKLGVLLSETNRYLICIGDERIAKSKCVGCASHALAVVPCEKEGTVEIVADSKASDTHHHGKGIGRSIELFWISIFIITLASIVDADIRHHPHGRQEYALAEARACSEATAFGAFDLATFFLLSLSSGYLISLVIRIAAFEQYPSGRLQRRAP